MLAATPVCPVDHVVPDDFPTVQAGLDAALPGDTVSVSDTPGPWFDPRCPVHVTLRATAGPPSLRHASLLTAIRDAFAGASGQSFRLLHFS